MVKIWTKMAFSIKKLRIIGSKKVPKNHQKSQKKLVKSWRKLVEDVLKCYEIIT